MFSNRLRFHALSSSLPLYFQPLFWLVVSPKENLAQQLRRRDSHRDIDIAIATPLGFDDCIAKTLTIERGEYVPPNPISDLCL